MHRDEHDDEDDLLHVFLDMPRRIAQERVPTAFQCRVARCDMGLPAHTSHPLSRLFACFAGPIPWSKRGHLTDIDETRGRDRSISNFGIWAKC